VQAYLFFLFSSFIIGTEVCFILGQSQLKFLQSLISTLGLIEAGLGKTCLKWPNLEWRHTTKTSKYVQYNSVICCFTLFLKKKTS